MAKYIYPAKFTRAEEGGFLVNFIDFDDIYTEGDTLEEAYYMAQDALYVMLPEYKEKLPKPSLNYMSQKTNTDEFITLVSLDTVEHEKALSKKVVKTTVTMPEWLKNMADIKNINFSKVLQDGLKRELNLL